MSMIGRVAGLEETGGGARPGDGRPRHPALRMLSGTGGRDLVPVGGGIGIALVCALVTYLLSGAYVGLVLTIGLGYGVVTIGMVLQLGYARQLAFSQSAFMGLGAYAVGVFTVKFGMNAFESLACAVVLSAAIALPVGVLLTRVPGLALALATLLLPTLLYSFVTYSSYLGTYTGIVGIPPLWNAGADFNATVARSGLIAAVAVGLAATMSLRITRSGTGLQVIAMASDEPLAESLGVSLRQRRVEVFVFGSVLAALGGALVACAQGDASPDLIASAAEISLLIMVVVPGSRSVLAVLAGALVVQYLSTYSAFISSNLTIFEGIFLVIVLLLEPNGFAVLGKNLIVSGWRAVAASRADRVKEAV